MSLMRTNRVWKVIHKSWESKADWKEKKLFACAKKPSPPFFMAVHQNKNHVIPNHEVY